MRYILISIVLFFSCTSKYENKLEVYRFDIELFNSDSITIKHNLKYWNSKHESFMQMFSDEIMQKGSMSSNEYTKQLLSFINHPDMREAFDSTLLIFSDISKIEQNLANSFAIYNNLFPEYPTPKVIACFNGFNYAVSSYEDNIIIGFEHFLGKDSRFYSYLGLPEYIRFQKQNRFILPNIMEVLYSHNFQDTIKDDLLSEIIHKGKIMYFIDQLLPNFSLADKIRYSEKEIDWVKDNESYIWSSLIENNMLFSSFKPEFRSFLEYAPFSKIISRKAPSRIAYYIGYRIIKSYVKYNDVAIHDLIKIQDARLILNKSKYKPQK